MVSVRGDAKSFAFEPRFRHRLRSHVDAANRVEGLCRSKVRIVLSIAYQFVRATLHWSMCSSSDWWPCLLRLSNDTTRVMTWFNASYLIRSSLVMCRALSPDFRLIRTIRMRTISYCLPISYTILAFEGRMCCPGRYGAAYPACPGKHAPCGRESPEGQPFFEFSAACMEFGRNLVEMLGGKAVQLPTPHNNLAWSPH